MYRLIRSRCLPALLLACTLSLPVSAQQYLPTAELRGAWIATVVNIDWPSAPGLSTERQQMEFDSILDVLKAMGMNAVFVQVRPAGDALYHSAVVPWSRYLTGQQGLAPEPFYDPLEYMVKAAHARHMEFHAWMNPYRATFDLDTASLAPNHPLRALPDKRKSEWFFRYGRRWYFNPASPLVRQHLINVVKEIVVKYDVDGIHFDDYFYPYKEANEPLQDYNYYAADPRGFTVIEDWRRDNVDRLIEGVSKMIKSLKPYVRFGVSPFGVWRNAGQDPLNGSQTRAGITCYDDLYADVVKWMKNGWVDYLAPQLYWSIGFPPADYEILLDWWSRHTYGKHLYAGHAAYKINNFPADPNWVKPDEINRQIAMNRSNGLVQGSIFFSVKPLLRNPLGVQDSLIGTLFPNQARVPGMEWLSKSPPATPQICRVGGSLSSVKLAWHACDIGSRDENPYYFAIYRFDGQSVGDFQNPRHLLAFTPFNTEKWIFEDPTAAAGEYYTYVVIAYNRFNVESYSSDPVVVKKTKTKAKRKKKLFGFLF
ncbi:MAG: family 10 glycosylhydrolase [Saprospirales bacterium]|nr:family 10 glycosylhydrolase [Saprospirales bacterium]